MSRHNHRLISDRSTIELPPNPRTGIAPPSPMASAAAEPVSKDLASAQTAPIAPSQRLPLIAHTLREARVGIAELRYEGRGGMGGFITELHDRHRTKSLSHSIDERAAQQLTGFLWQLVLSRHPSWSDSAGSFGVVTWNLKTDLMRHVHHQRIMEVKTTLIEGL
jgi:hypothetical protein